MTTSEKELLENERRVTVDVQETMEEYLHQNDWRVNENANQGYSLGWLILNTSGKVTANYWLKYKYTPEIWAAHKNWDYHIHDLGFFWWYCAGWSLRQLLEEGFNGVPNKVESFPPKNLQSAVNQMVNFLGTLQNEWAGAQAFSSFDTYLAPFVHKYETELAQKLEEMHSTLSNEEKQAYIDKETYKYVRQQMQNLVFGLNTPSRWGTQTPFTNITLDLVCPDDLKEKSLFLRGATHGEYVKKFWELEPEMRIINKALLEVYIKGDMQGRVFTFPIPTYNITEEFPWDDEIIHEVFVMTAKYGIPYFQNFVGSQYITKIDENWNKIKERNPYAYTPWAVRSMCCRLQLDLTQLEKRWGGLFWSAEMTGSIWVVTINLARIGYVYKNDPEGFKNRIRELMDLAKQSLEIKRSVVTQRMAAGLYPYTKRYLHSFRNHFSTIGINGMNEAIRNFTNDVENITTAWGKQFSNEIMDMMRDILTDYQEETGNLYNLEATPAEGATYRFAKEDKKQFPWIIQAGSEDAPYYTNSTQLPVEFSDDVFEALDHQDDLQCKYTWGTVFHIYLGEKVSDWYVCKSLVKKVLENYKMPYITITPTFSICPKHGYIAWEHDYCPICDEEIGYTGEEFDTDTRKKYSWDPVIRMGWSK